MVDRPTQYESVASASGLPSHDDEWDGESGRRQKLEVIAQTVEFLDPRKTAAETREQSEPVAA